MNDLIISEIQVSRLFDELNYDIKLPVENPIAIITAPNGRGKTTILNLISFLFTPSTQAFLTISSVPFETFSCVLSNGMTVKLEKKNNDPFLSKQLRNAEAHKMATKGTVRPINAGSNRIFEELNNLVFSITKGKKRVGQLQFSGMLETINDAVRRLDPRDFLNDDNEESYYRNTYFSRACNMIWDRMETVLNENGCKIPINYIKADRIQPVSVPTRRGFDEAKSRQGSPLQKASDTIAEIIVRATDDYYTAVSRAKDKLPKMFLENEGGNLNADEFMDAWTNYRKELSQFQELGLITPTEDFVQGKDIHSVYPEKGKFLSTYLWAFKDTTQPLQSIYERLNLFKSIIDERNAITGKKLYFSREGVRIMVGNREISLETLSSGEKHDFIMFFNLIIGSEQNGLVLIDEPEISLHIEWQETYLDRLLSICKMNGLRAIIATHSPNIVSSHYDFLVDKGETDG